MPNYQYVGTFLLKKSNSRDILGPLLDRRIVLNRIAQKESN